MARCGSSVAGTGCAGAVAQPDIREKTNATEAKRMGRVMSIHAGGIEKARMWTARNGRARCDFDFDQQIDTEGSDGPEAAERTPLGIGRSEEPGQRSGRYRWSFSAPSDSSGAFVSCGCPESELEVEVEVEVPTPPSAFSR
jgi:hypothetical protein